MAAHLSLSAADLAHIDDSLSATDALLERNYPGDDGSRQPVHTVYVPADKFTPTLAADWGSEALALANDHGGLERLGSLLGQDAELAAAVAPRVAAKLAAEPIEDLRLDFEDGYGNRGDEAEDAAAVTAARAVNTAVAAGHGPAVHRHPLQVLRGPHPGPRHPHPGPVCLHPGGDRRPAGRADPDPAQGHHR